MKNRKLFYICKIIMKPKLSRMQRLLFIIDMEVNEKCLHLAQPDHDPNTQHCLCGADADLIMLGLATHEPNFTIIREEFKPNKPRPCDLCGQLGTILFHV